jgi:uncharacterized protein
MPHRIMRTSIYARYSLPILMGFCFAAPLLIQGAHRAIRSNTNKVVDWLPKSFQETQELQWFRKHFVADQFVVISWPGCTLGDKPDAPNAQQDDPRIERLAKLLVPSKHAAAIESESDHTKYFQAVTTARRTLNELTSKPSEVPYDEAVKRLTGTLIGSDGRQTCVVVMLSDAAIEKFRLVVGRHVPNGPMPWHRQPGVIIEALRKCGIDPETARLGGPPVENVAIDEEGDRTLARLATYSGLLGLVLAWWSLRSVRLTLIVFACGVLSAAAGLAFVFWTGQTTDAVMMAMPSMLYVLAISGAVHLVNYYRDAVHEHGLEGAPERALAHGWKPAFLCNVTTGIGLASLSTSDLEPIRKFGIYSAAGVALMLIFLFLFLPAALHYWPVQLGARRREDAEHDHPDGLAGLGEGTIWFEEYWRRFGSAIIRHHAAVSVACFAFIFIVGLGLTRVTTNIDLLKLFDNKVRVRQDYQWLESNIGRLVPLEVVIQFPAEKQRSASEAVDASQAARKMSYLERLELVWLTQQTIDRELGPSGRNLVGPSLSPVTFAPEIPSGSRDVAERRVTDVKLEESEAALERSGYLHDDPETGSELWRISLRAAAFADLDYGAFVNSVRTIIDPVLAAQRLREEALAEVASARPDGSIGGASVCLWNRPAASANAMGRGINVAEIYSTSAQELLAKARLKLTAADVDLAALPEDQRQAAIDYFKSFDCVVVLGGVPDADIQAIAKIGARVVDGRDGLKTHSDTVSPVGHTHLADVGAVYTGVVPIVYKAQRALLENLIQSSFWSFVTITPLIMLVCRSIFGGAVVMLPNALPVLVVFGGMGWLGVPVDIGSMMAASIALGVAVDDTIHYLTWYREGLIEFGDRNAAIISAYKRCAPPTLQAALISGLGLAVFAFSTFTPTQRLGWLMMTILLAGVVAELIMLPAILAGPLGKAFPVPRRAELSAVPPPHIPSRKGELVSQT